VENRSTPEASASRRTSFDQVHRLSGWAWLRRDSDKNNVPRARLTEARWARYCDSSTPVEAEYTTTRSSRSFVVSARIRSMRWAGSTSSVRSEHSSWRRSSASGQHHAVAHRLAPGRF
jgi:hypothetical protein